MKRAGLRVGTGTRFVYDGEVIEVVEMHSVAGMPEVLTRDLRRDTVRRFALDELMYSARSRLLSEDLVAEVADVDADLAGVRWSAAPESARHRARERAAQVREALTGYRSGSAQTALPGEPRPRYKDAVLKGDRLAAKANELNIGLRNLRTMGESLRV
jgi:hypothetical protein